MRMIKRALISVSNRLGKSMLLLLVIVTAMTLVLSSMAIQGAVHTASENAKKAIDANVSMSIDFNKLMQGGDMNEDPINDKLVEQVKKSTYAKKISLNLSAYISSDLKQVVDKKDNQPEQSFQMDGAPAGAIAPTNKLFGMDNIDDIDDFINGKKKLIDGVYPYESDKESPILISKDYATLNNLKIGDTMKLNTAGLEKAELMTFTVSGIFEPAKENKPKSQFSMPMEDARNTFYSNFTAVKKGMCIGQTDCQIRYEDIKVALASGEDIIPFIAEMKATTEGSNEFIKYSSDLDQYEKQTTAIQKVAGISQIIVWVSGVAAIIVLSLLIMMSLRDRKYEMGILLSIGETRLNIIGQILVEVLLVAIVAFVVSFGTGTVVSKALGDYLINSEVQNSQLQQMPGMDSMPGGTIVVSGGDDAIMPGGDGIVMPGDNNVPAIDTIDVKLADTEVLLKSYGVGFGIIIISTIFPIIWMMRENPKNIMLRKE